MRLRSILPALLSLSAAIPAAAQHEHQGGAPSGSAGRPLGIPAAREASGTSWLPDLSPMHAFHAELGRWSLMFHGQAFVQYVREGSRRGASQLGSVNWAMAMARTMVAGGELSARAMLSAEPLTVGECGFPVLLQSGEECDGRPLHDRQHPHDLFMELAAGYQRALTGDVGFLIYGGPVAEAALGPVAFPHRPSAMPSPSAPITHHWLDASHIAFGSATAGLFGRRWKVEGSVFNGREPDENRFDFDFAPLDSYSGRLTLLPGDGVALQVSAGHLREAEPEAHGSGRIDVDRFTASAIHHRAVGGRGLWASTLAWGHNVEHGRGTSGVLLESALELAGNVIFGRAEWAQKTGHDLVLPDHDLEEAVFGVSQVMGGYARQLGPVAGWTPGIGARASVSLLPEELKPFYGERAPVGFAVWASVRPAAMRMAATEQIARPPQPPAPLRPGPPNDVRPWIPEQPSEIGALPATGLAAGDVQAVLRTEGIQVGRADTLRTPLWAVPAVVLPVAGAQAAGTALQVMAYSSPALARLDLGNVNLGALPAGTPPPHLFLARNLVILLLADPQRDARVVTGVEAALGRLGAVRVPLRNRDRPHH